MKAQRLSKARMAERMETSHSQTGFRRAVFGGAPAFFDTTLHEDTDFGHID